MVRLAAFRLFVWLFALSVPCLCAVDAAQHYIDHGYTQNPNISHWLGSKSPYFAVHSKIPDYLPQGCRMSFGQILHRHGSRVASQREDGQFRATLRKIQESVAPDKFSGRYAFLRDPPPNFTNELGSTTKLGAVELLASGIKSRRRYGQLSRSQRLFARSSISKGRSRVEQSAITWLKGYHSPSSAERILPNLTMIADGKGFTSSIAYGSCPAFEASIATEKYQFPANTWARFSSHSTLKRLNRNLPNANLTVADLLILLKMCALCTIYNGRLSPLCGLFSEEDIHNYNYYETLYLFYKAGPGHRLGPTQGIGFVNELLARMTSQPVNDSTSTNSTLDGNPETFPIGPSHQMFADFTHDSFYVSVLFALNLYPWRPLYPYTSMKYFEDNYGRVFSSSLDGSMAARAYIEKMECDDHPEEYVRILVNDRVMPQPACGSDELGRCTISNFVASLEWARSMGNWHECFE